MSKPVRVRFAPAPTGHLHIGSLRTALFNWLFARRYHGTFVVRVEDTDLERSREEYTRSIFETLHWCDIESDEPVMFQSQRTELYADYAGRLLATGALYRCYCTQEEVRARVRAVSQEGTEYFVYDGACRDRIDQPIGVPYALRFRVPRDRVSIVAHDLIRGPLQFPLSAIDDFVVVRSDGSPMYNFTVVIDDAVMEISHVIRGDDHIINTPRQLLLYEAAGYVPPEFAHVPLILGKDGAKLSKREAATAVAAYRDAGFFAEALCNYLVRLGWSHGDIEVIDRDALIAVFSLSGVGAKGAYFDYAKLLWMNSVYMKQLTPADIVGRLYADVDPDMQGLMGLFTDEQVHGLVRIYQSRVRTLIELRDVLRAIAQPVVDPAYRAQLSEKQRAALYEIMAYLSRESQCVDELAMKSMMARVLEHHGLTMAECATPIRVALTGTSVAPSVVDLIRILGCAESIRRLQVML